MANVQQNSNDNLAGIKLGQQLLASGMDGVKERLKNARAKIDDTKKTLLEAKNNLLEIRKRAEDEAAEKLRAEKEAELLKAAEAERKAKEAEETVRSECLTTSRNARSVRKAAPRRAPVRKPEQDRKGKADSVRADLTQGKGRRLRLQNRLFRHLSRASRRTRISAKNPKIPTISRTKRPRTRGLLSAWVTSTTTASL